MILAILLSLAAHAAEPAATFTTVFLDDEDVVYVGLKRGNAPGTSEVISFPFGSGSRTSIPLPDLAAGRDIIGIIPEKKYLFVLTVGTGEKNDGPMLHAFDRAKAQWVLVGKLNCPTFTKATIQPGRMIFSCETSMAPEAKSGKKKKKSRPRVVRKAILFGRHKIFRRGVWRFPEFMLRYKTRTVILEGAAPHWDKLRLRGPDGQRTISADDLQKLPEPGSDGASPPKN